MRELAILICLAAVVIMVLILETACSPPGPPAPPLTAETKQTIAQDQQTSAIAAAKASDAGVVALAQQKAKAAASLANGASAPVTHPIAAANVVVVKVRPWLIAAAIASSALWAIAFGLSFTALPFVGLLASITPALRWLAVLAWAALFALPWLPAGFLLILVAAVGLGVYELVKDKGNLVHAFEDSEGLLGFSAGTVTLTPTPTPTPTPTKPAPPAAAASPPAALTPAVAKAA